jgi:diguanylate cyclase (GGDEF)-like protein/PAS domain S-box-containing protein
MMKLINRIQEEWSVFTPVKAEVLRNLYQNSAPQITAFSLALLFAIAILNTNVAPSNVYLWLVIVIIAYLVRAVLSISYHRAKPLNIFWLNRFRIATVLTALAWSSCTILLFLPGDMLNQSIILFTLTGLCTGAAISYAIDYLVLFGFLLPVTLSMFFRLLAEGSNASITMSLMVALFLIFVTGIARKTNRSYIKNIDLVNTAILGESREKAYSRIMEMIAKSAPLDKILVAISLNFEKQNPTMLCSILVLDAHGKHLKLAAAPSLPDFYNNAVDGIAIGANVGCCGAAAFSGEPCFAEDLLTHPNWRDYTALTTKANLRACWSEPIKDSTGKVLGTFAIYHDVPATPTERDRQTINQNAALAGIAIGLAQNYHEQRLATLLYQNTNESMMVTDSNNLIIAVNPAFTTDTGYSAEEVIGRNPSFLKSDRHNNAFYENLYQELKITGKWQGEIWNRRKNGDLYAEWIRVSTICDDDGRILNRVSLATDITARKESEDIIWKQANFDSLTGLPNRRMFHDRFLQEVKKSHRSNLPLALLFIDLDEFKEVNDTIGHQMGDVLLKETAKRLTSCVRESDTVSYLESVARLGGDEFTVILSEIKDIECVERIAQRILSKVAEPYQLGEDVAYISASIGITLYPNDSTDIDSLIKNADQAMYAAKREGKNCFSYFTKSMQMNAQNRMQLTKDLRNALKEQQLNLVYQPIVNLRTNKVHKAEALIRWQHPTKGLISPAEFIPIAESIGLINTIGDWVFLEALAQSVAWRQSIHSNFQISINKSPVQFYNVSKLEADSYLNWADHLREHGLSGECIAVEITEGLLLENNDAVYKQLLEFRDAGIQVALDDFGTGYSSLSYLKKFDIDYIKIDQSFVQNIENDSDNMVLCQAIIVMAHKLKLKVIAEGIETQEQLDLLKFAGCDFGQGYFLSKPLTKDAFEEFIANAS